MLLRMHTKTVLSHAILVRKHSIATRFSAGQFSFGSVTSHVSAQMVLFKELGAARLAAECPNDAVILRLVLTNDMRLQREAAVELLSAVLAAEAEYTEMPSQVPSHVSHIVERPSTVDACILVDLCMVAQVSQQSILRVLLAALGTRQVRLRRRHSS